MCLPKIYINASMRRLINDGARSMEGMPRRSRKWAFLEREKSADRHEVMFVGQSPRGRFNKQSV